MFCFEFANCILELDKLVQKLARREMNENYISREVDHSKDSQNLGRWLWLRIEGKDNVSTVFIPAYKPCKNTKGITSILNQQVR